MQLELPLEADVVRAWTVHAEGPGEVALEVALLTHGARARLLGRWRSPDGYLCPRAAQWTFEVRVRAPVILRTTALAGVKDLFDPARGEMLRDLEPALDAAVEHAETMLDTRDPAGPSRRRSASYRHTSGCSWSTRRPRWRRRSIRWFGGSSTG